MIWTKRTGTNRRIGAGQAGNPVPVRLDEGVSEAISLFVSGKKEKLDLCKKYYSEYDSENPEPYDFLFYTGYVLAQIKDITADALAKIIKENTCKPQTTKNKTIN